MRFETFRILPKSPRLVDIQVFELMVCGAACLASAARDVAPREVHPAWGFWRAAGRGGAFIPPQVLRLG